MASIADTIFISLGLKSDEFNKSMNKAKDNIQKTSQSLAQGADQVSAKAFSQIAGIARMVAAPLAGAMSMGAMIKSYFGGVAQVAQMTGAYSTKLEEWRKKRALLNRVTREDIQLYKKSREAMVRFQIVMGDLSAKIMRGNIPVMKRLVDWLNKISDWVDRYSDDIVRFLQITSAVIGTLLIPQLLRMAAALAANPITWIVAALVGLIAVIDDLVVWLNGGESALDSFWSQFGSREEVLAKIQAAVKWLTETLQALWENIKAGIKSAVEWFDDFWTKSQGTERVIYALKSAFEILGDVFKDLGVIWDEVVAILSETGFLDALTEAFDNAIDVITGAFTGFFAFLQMIFGAIKGLLTGDWDSFTKAAEKAVEAVKQVFTGLVNVIKTILDQIWEIAKAVFGRIADSIKNLLSFDGLKESAGNLLQKANPMNWFKGDNPVEAGESAERAIVAQNSSKTQNNTLYSSPTVVLNNPSPEAVRESMSSVGADQRTFDDYINQNVRSTT